MTKQNAPTLDKQTYFEWRTLRALEPKQRTRTQSARLRDIRVHWYTNQSQGALDLFEKQAIAWGQEFDSIGAELALKLDVLRNRYFRSALEGLTGVAPPEHFRWRDNDQTTEQQDWCITRVRPHWACGISLLDAAEAFVTEAESNCNIIYENAQRPADWDPADIDSNDTIVHRCDGGVFDE